VFFHYHRVRVGPNGRHDWQPPGYVITRAQRRLVYDPYLRGLEDALHEIQTVAPGFTGGLEQPPPRAALAYRRIRTLASRSVHRALAKLSSGRTARRAEAPRRS